MIRDFYRLRKCKNTLRHIYALYKKKWNTLPQERVEKLEQDMSALDSAILEGNREQAHELTKKLEGFEKRYLKKSPWDHLKEIVFALSSALIIATIVRQVWFEPMEIPTGSMRPTFKEQDRLIVAKDRFGINIPLKAQHLFFNSNLLQRTGVFIFRPENMDIPNSDTTYFGLPGKKRFIKRCMGKPGDTLYFYGGKIYGFDEQKNDLTELRLNSELEHLEHIPFINFEGKVTTTAPNARGMYSPVFFYQMNQLIGKHTLSSSGNIQGALFIEKQWQPESSSKESSHSYKDFWGIKNFAMARLLSSEDLHKFSKADLSSLEEAPLYLELRHSPSLLNPKPDIIRDHRNRIRPSISTHTTVIPLQDKHLEKIMHSLYTSRFVIKDGLAQRYSAEKPQWGHRDNYPHFPDVEDGTYEFYHGKAASISWSGRATPLEEGHPLYQVTPENIKKLFNLGIEFHQAYAPFSKKQIYFPSRYAYFREGDLLSMGSVIFEKDDPLLLAFHKREAALQNRSPQYTPFQDYGPPLLSNGDLDIKMIQKYGLKIPEKMYLALGDNHASSSDSRDFGFVPEENIRGGASIILWPDGERWGTPLEQPTPWLTAPRMLIWTIFTLIIAFFYVFQKIRFKKPVFHKLSQEN